MNGAVNGEGAGERPIKLSCRNVWKVYGPDPAGFARNGGTAFSIACSADRDRVPRETLTCSIMQKPRAAIAMMRRWFCDSADAPRTQRSIRKTRAATTQKPTSSCARAPARIAPAPGSAWKTIQNPQNWPTFSVRSHMPAKTSTAATANRRIQRASSRLPTLHLIAA